MSDLRAMLDKRYEGLAAAISATVGDWLGHDTPFDPHGWRCEDKTRYPGPCGCDGEMADEVMGALEAILPGLLAQAWDQGAAAAWERSTVAINAERYCWRSAGEPLNPYRQESDR